MKRSENRILTTHVGSLPRPRDLIELYQQDAPDSTLLPRLKSAVADIVKQQVAAGVDVVDDGEFGKAMRRSVDYGAWWSISTIGLPAMKSARHERRRGAKLGLSEVESARSSRNSTQKTAGWGVGGKPAGPVPRGCSGWFAPDQSGIRVTRGFGAISKT